MSARCPSCGSYVDETVVCGVCGAGFCEKCGILKPVIPNLSKACVPIGHSYYLCPKCKGKAGNAGVSQNKSNIILKILYWLYIGWWWYLGKTYIVPWFKNKSKEEQKRILKTIGIVFAGLFGVSLVISLILFLTGKYNV